MNAKSKIENELLAVTKGKPMAEGADRQAYLKDMLKSINGLAEKDWSKLGTPAQDWFNSSCKLVNEKKPIADFPDLEVPAAAPAPARATMASNEDNDSDNETPKTASAPAPAAPAVTAPVTTPKMEPPPKPKVAETKTEAPAADGAPKKRGGVKELKRLVIANPEAKQDELLTQLKAAGFEVGSSTAVSVIYDLKQTLDLLKEMGRLK